MCLAVCAEGMESAEEICISLLICLMQGVFNMFNDELIWPLILGKVTSYLLNQFENKGHQNISEV